MGYRLPRGFPWTALGATPFDALLRVLRIVDSGLYASDVAGVLAGFEPSHSVGDSDLMFIRFEVMQIELGRSIRSRIAVGQRR